MKKDREQGAKEHNCDGRCYWSTGMCPMVETCEETRTKEFIGTIMTALTVIFAPIILVVMIIIFFVVALK